MVERSVHVRPERDGDHAAVEALVAEAFEAEFGSRVEAQLVAALRQQARPLLSLVAEVGDELVGHILFSPVTVRSLTGLEASDGLMGLAPMAARVGWQRRGIGSALVRAGLETLQQQGAHAVLVLGHPAFYPRFGFRRARDFDLVCEYEVPDEHFMALELQPQALADVRGRVHDHPAFGAL